MLGHFQRLDQVEAALEVERGGEIMGAEIVSRNGELVLADIIAVDRDYVLDPRRQPFRRPRAMAGADVEQAVDRDLRPQQCRHRARRAARPGVDIIVKIVRILMLDHRVPPPEPCR